MPAVRRPGGCIDRTLPAIYISDHFGLPAGRGYQAQVNMFIKRMVIGLYLPGKADEYNPLSIWRNMREPVIIFIVRDLFLVTAIRLHPPDLHGAGSFGI